MVIVATSYDARHSVKDEMVNSVQAANEMMGLTGYDRLLVEINDVPGVTVLLPVYLDTMRDWGDLQDLLKLWGRFVANHPHPKGEEA